MQSTRKSLEIHFNESYIEVLRALNLLLEGRSLDDEELVYCYMVIPKYIKKEEDMKLFLQLYKARNGKKEDLVKGLYS